MIPYFIQHFHSKYVSDTRCITKTVTDIVDLDEEIIWYCVYDVVIEWCRNTGEYYSFINIINEQSDDTYTDPLNIMYCEDGKWLDFDYMAQDILSQIDTKAQDAYDKLASKEESTLKQRERVPTYEDFLNGIKKRAYKNDEMFTVYSTLEELHETKFSGNIWNVMLELHVHNRFGKK